MARQPAPGVVPGRHSAAAEDQERRQAGRQPVGDVVEARREPAEMHVARRAVADHAVEGVDRLVRGHARAGRTARPRASGATTPSAKFSAVEFDRGAGDAVRVQARRVAADDVSATARRPSCESLLQTGGHRCDVLVQPARRDQGAHGQAEQQPAVAADRGTAPARREQPPRSAPITSRLASRPRRACIGRRHRRIEPARLQPGDDRGPSATTGCGRRRQSHLGSPNRASSARASSSAPSSGAGSISSMRRPAAPRSPLAPRHADCYPGPHRRSGKGHRWHDWSHGVRPRLARCRRGRGVRASGPRTSPRRLPEYPLESGFLEFARPIAARRPGPIARPRRRPRARGARACCSPPATSRTTCRRCSTPMPPSTAIRIEFGRDLGIEPKLLAAARDRIEAALAAAGR